MDIWKHGAITESSSILLAMKVNILWPLSTFVLYPLTIFDELFVDRGQTGYWLVTACHDLVAHADQPKTCNYISVKVIRQVK